MQAFYVKENFCEKINHTFCIARYLLDSVARLWSDDGLLGWPHMRGAVVYCDVVVASCVRSVSAERRVDVFTL